MIKLTSFYPFSSFLRVSQDFYEDKVIVKEKSLTYEREFEFNYSELGEISDKYYGSSNQNKFSFWLIAYTALALSLFHNFINAYLFLIRTAQILFIGGIILNATSYIKSWYIIFSDKNGKILTQIKQNRNKQELIFKVIKTIKGKLEDIQEISVTNPFPEAKAAFEYIEYNDLNTTKTIERFYENEMFGFKKRIEGESVYHIKYNQLSGKVYRAKADNIAWGYALTISTLIISIIGGLVMGFGVHLGIFVVYFSIGLIVLVAISFMLKFIKREIIGLYDSNGNIIYSIKTNRSNKEKVEEIIKFVQSKIPSEKKD